jgi:hypothetical protein
MDAILTPAEAAAELLDRLQALDEADALLASAELPAGPEFDALLDQHAEVQKALSEFTRGELFRRDFDDHRHPAFYRKIGSRACEAIERGELERAAADVLKLLSYEQRFTA